MMKYFERKKIEKSMKKILNCERKAYNLILKDKGITLGRKDFDQVILIRFHFSRISSPLSNKE